MFYLNRIKELEEDVEDLYKEIEETDDCAEESEDEVRELREDIFELREDFQKTDNNVQVMLSTLALIAKKLKITPKQFAVMNVGSTDEADNFLGKVTEELKKIRLAKTPKKAPVKKKK